MNPRRLAALHRRRAELLREQAELEDEIADALAEEQEGATSPRRRGAPRPPVLPPERPPSDVDKALARRRLRGMGIVRAS